MWVILALPNGGTSVDWERYSTMYKRNEYARRIARKLRKTGLYEQVAVVPNDLKIIAEFIQLQQGV